MNNFFLLNLKIAGIKNIEKPIEIPFYKKTIKNDFDPEQYHIKGIYGENGSGKTAIMTAVKILKRILIDRNYLTDSINQKDLVACVNKKAKKGFIEVQFYSFLGMGPFIYRYRVEFQTDNDDRVRLTSEIFERKLGHNSQAFFLTVYKTNNGELIRFGEKKSEERFELYKEKTQNLLDIRSFAVAINDIEKHINNPGEINLYHIFTLMVFASSLYVEIDGEDDHRNHIIDTIRNENDETILHESLTIYNWSSMKRNDPNGILIPRQMISYYEKDIARLFSFIRLFKSNLINIRIDKKEYGDFFACRRVLVYEEYEIDEEYESKGIKKLMNLFDILDSACNGNIVFIDELDSSINDVYLDKLLEYISYYGEGQLCFTAHNLSPMSVLRNSKCAISFISSVNTVHTWTTNGNLNPEHAYREGFIDDSPFNVEASDFLGILGGTDE